VSPQLFTPKITSANQPRVITERRGQSTFNPTLSVVIVNYYQWGETADLIRQLGRSNCLTSAKAEVVVVDNHSPSNPIAGWLRRRRGVSLRRWSKNRGFARAVNEGCRLSQGKWLLLMNSDMAVREGFLDGVSALTEQLELEDPRAGIVGFQLRNSDGSRQWSTGPFPNLIGTLLRLALPRSWRKYHRIRGRNRIEVPWVTGCCLLARRECIDELGGLDDSFFLYYEDVDLCRRARDRGWTVWFEPRLRVIHHRPLHGRAVAVPIRVLTRHALMTYAAKHWMRWQARLLARIVQAESWVRNRWKRLKSDPEKAAQFEALETIAAHFAKGNPLAANRRLRLFIRAHEGEQLANCQLPVGRGTKAQPLAERQS
jgi:GT2 family glycosyltransferase